MNSFIKKLIEKKLDKVDQDELKGDHKDRKDKDINNDNRVDSSDEYLHKRRKAISKAMNKEEAETLDEVSTATLQRYKTKANKDIDHYTDEKIVKKRSKGYALASKKLTNRIMNKEAKEYGPGHIGAIQKMLDKEREAKKAKESMKKEEVEQIDEISRNLARSYIRKAAANNADRKDKVMKPFPMKDIDKNIEMHKKFKKREAGIELAGKKAYGIGGKAKVSATEEVELDEKAYVSSLSPGLGRKGSHDVINKDGKVVKSYPYTKDGMKAAQAHLSKMKEDFEPLDEISQKTLWNYHAKAGADLQKKREKLDKGTLTMKDLKKGQNRVKGLNRAADKMHEENEPLDEISRDLAHTVAKKRQAQASDLRQKAVDEPDMMKAFAHTKAANAAEKKAGKSYNRLMNKEEAEETDALMKAISEAIKKGSKY